MVMNNVNNEIIVNPHNHPYLTFIHDKFPVMRDRMFQEVNEPIRFAKIFYYLANSWRIHKNQQIPIDEAMDISFNNWRNEVIQN